MISESTLINLREAKRAYDIATRVYWAQRDAGGIVALDPDDIDEREEIAKGRKFKPATPAGRIAFGNWQKCKAELDAAHNVHRMESGDTECPVCPKGDEKIAATYTDNRLPPGDR